MSGKITDGDLVVLSGNTHLLALPQFDKGIVAPVLALDRVQLVLQRSPEQEASLQKLLAEQLDPTSANFHHWLHAAEFGALYGPSDADLAAISGWLGSHGFSNIQPSQGRVTLEFDGTAGQIEEAFHTEIHHYVVNGKTHLANDRNPQIPRALAPVVAGIASLHDFRPRHQSVLGRFVTINRMTHQSRPLGAPVRALGPEFYGPKPLFSFDDPNDYDIQNEDIGPYDFAALYNLTPLWNAGITGKGVSIAIAARTDINPADIATFRKFFGLSKFSGAVKKVLNGADPGIVQDSLVENTLDTEWAGASAPDAEVIVVSSKSTATTDAAILSVSYIVDNEVASIMSASYGQCEAEIGKAGNAQLNAMFQQGSAEGISLFESVGDQGSTGCDDSDATSFPAPAQHGLQVNGWASSPYITGVGGTDLVWQEDAYSKYWTDNNSDSASAIGHIPEIPWNSTCNSYYLLKYVYTGEPSAEAACNDAIGAGLDQLVQVSGGSGGKSACVTNDGAETSCTGGYAKPTWQSGVGVPSDGARDVPDVSLFASDGLPYNGGSAYLICVASNSREDSCDYTDDEITAQEVGGTSVSSPAMAGIMALVVQKAGKSQGLANPMLYKLAAKDNRATCNSNTVANGNSCVFYDVTSGNNAMPCVSGSPNCTVKTSGDEIGIVAGYTTTVGYDLATGLGSVNAYNLVSAWTAAGSAALTLTVSPTSASFGSIAVGAASDPKTVTLTNSGKSTITLSSIALTGSQADDFVLSKTCGSILSAGASCTLSPHFKPVAVGAKSASISIADNATGSPQLVTLTGTGTAATERTVKLSAASLAFGNQASGSASVAKTVTLTNSGTSTVTLSLIELSGSQTDDFTLSKTCASTLAVGASCTLSVSFKPVATGAKSASISIADNASGSPQSVALTGTAVTAAALKLSATSLAFASQASGTKSTAKSVTLTNSGTATVTFTSIALTGSQTDDFVLSKTCSSTLAAGASCILSVSFEPVAAGAKSARVSIADNAGGSPQTVLLTGTGT